MEGDGSNSPTVPENEYTELLAENVEGFQRLFSKAVAVMEKDENSYEMTAESYMEKSGMKLCLLELSDIHKSLAAHFEKLIKNVSMHCPSLLQNQHIEASESTYPHVSQKLALTFTTATGYDLLLQLDGGGFYLSKSKGSSHSGSESFLSFVIKPPILAETKGPGSETNMSSVGKPAVVEPVNDGSLKLEETKDPGSVSSMTSANKLEVAPVIDDALKAEETKYPDSECAMSVNKLQETEKSDLLLRMKTLDEEYYTKINYSNIVQQNQKLKQDLLSAQDLLSTARKRIKVQLERYYELQNDIKYIAAEAEVRVKRGKKKLNLNKACPHL